MSKLELFIKSANNIHNGNYGYSEFKFTGITKKSTVICSNCGPFLVTPNAHINYSIGCPTCDGKPKKKIVLKNTKKSTFKELLNK